MTELYPVSLTPSITERGIHVIKQWERFRATPYGDGFDSKGNPVKSIGFGHSNQLLTFPFDENSVWTEIYAHEVLTSDLEFYEKLLLPHLKVPVPDTIWSICLSLAYNKGIGTPGGEKGLINSEAWKILHDGGEYPFERFCEAILKYAIIAPNKITGELEEKRGLRWRREAEAGLYQQDRFRDYK
jgi:GH24 family phage-related lysozyme (muramidase)